MRTARARAGAGWALLAALIGAIGGCSRSQEGTGGRLTVTGSSTLAPVVALLAADYEREHPGVRIDVQSGGSSRGILDVRRGLADLGMVSRRLAEEEQGLHVYPIARDGVGLILNAGNPVPALSGTQVASIYRGRIRSWGELGGPDAPIVVVHKAEGRATRAVFLAHFGIAGHEVDADVLVGENEQAVKTVAGSPNAIGYVSISTAAIDIEHGVPIRLLGVDGIEATLESLRSGRYPIARPLNLVALEPAEGLARDFINFVLSPAAEPRFAAQRFLQVRP